MRKLPSAFKLCRRQTGHPGMLQAPKAKKTCVFKYVS
jgi:hypothetical protein